jgi:hypothetical protein
MDEAMHSFAPRGSPTRLLWLTPGQASRSLLDAALEMTRADDSWEVAIVAGSQPPGKTAAVNSRVTVHVLGSQETDCEPLSCELAELIAPCAIVHLLDSCTTSAALALLIARLRGLPVVATDPGSPSGLWAALDLVRLVAHMLPRASSVHETASIYGRLLGRQQEAA